MANGEKVEYLLVGGYAVAFYGFPRATGDIDLWVASSSRNQTRLAKAFELFGFKINEPHESFLSEGQFIAIGSPPLRIEVLTAIDGVEFAECYASRNRVVMDGVNVDVIPLDRLKQNKIASGRLKDRNDLENLR